MEWKRENIQAQSAFKPNTGACLWQDGNKRWKRRRRRKGRTGMRQFLLLDAASDQRRYCQTIAEAVATCSATCSLTVGNGARNAEEALLPQALPEGLEDVEGASLDRRSGEARKYHGGVTRQWDLRQCVLSPDYWMLWTSMYMGIGSGFTLLNNLGEHRKQDLKLARPAANNIVIRSLL